MFKHLLVPLDGSSLAEAVLPAASALAQKSGARVTLLHVVERRAPASVHGLRHLAAAGEAEAYLGKLAAEAFAPGVEVAWHVHAREVRDVAHSVVDHADELAPDLVVMCAHGEGRARDWLSGTIPQQVVNQGVIPVLLLRPGPSGSVSFPFRCVLAPLDGKPEHERALPGVVALAQICEAPVRLLAVVPTSDSLSGSQAVTSSLLPEATRAMLDLAEERAAEYLGIHVQQLKALGIAASARVSRGDPADLIAETASQDQADLIALGTHGKAGTQAFWSGSLAQRLIRRIGASFLLAPAPAQDAL